MPLTNRQQAFYLQHIGKLTTRIVCNATALSMQAAKTAEIGVSGFEDAVCEDLENLTEVIDELINLANDAKAGKP